MPTYQNNRQALLYIEGKHNPRTGVPTERVIGPKEIFVAHSSEVPERWLSPSPHEPNNPEPWVTQVSAEPTDEQLSA